MAELAQTHVTIVGLGLMGGSLALALREQVARLTAVDVDAATRERALVEGVVDAATGDLAAGVQDADLVVLATPVRAILDVIGALPHLRPGGCLLLDLGSTKGQICAAMDRLPAGFQAVGGHPMCGKETAGLAAATPDLYRDQTFVLCRTARTTPAGERLAVQVVEAVGATPRFLPPDAHDQLVALVSHLPALVAGLLMEQAAATAAKNEHVWPVSASGFRDTARLAGSDPAMMRDILRTNRPGVVAELKRYRNGLDALITLLQNGDDDALAQWLAARQREHRTYRRHKP